MALHDISVEDILHELETRNGKKSSVPSVPDMDKIDALVKSIVNKRFEEENNGRSATLKEKIQLEEEIKAHSRTLTNQFAAIKKQTPTIGDSENPSDSNSSSINLLKLKGQQAIKYHDTGELLVAAQLVGKRGKRYNELKKNANSTSLKNELNELSEHFAGDKTDSTQDNSKQVINPTVYKELKSNRNKKIDSFVLDPKKPPSPAEEILEKSLKERVEPPIIKEDSQPEPIGREFSDSHLKTDDILEYTSPEKAVAIKRILHKNRKNISISMIALLVLFVISLPLFFVTKTAEGFSLFSIISMSPSGYATLNILFVVLSLLASLPLFINSLHSMSEQKHDKDILFSALMVLQLLVVSPFIISPKLLLNSNIEIYTPVLIAVLLVNFLSKYLTVNKIIKDFDYITSPESKISTVSFVTPQSLVNSMIVSNPSEEENLVTNNETAFPRDFLSHALNPDEADDFSTKVLGALLPIGLIFFILVFLLSRDLYYSLSVSSISLLITVGFLTSLSVILPIHDSAPVVEHFSGISPNYEGVKTFNDTTSLLLDASEVFTQESVNLIGIKTFQGRRIDEALIDAASILVSSNSILKHIFLDIISNKKELLKEVDSIVYEGAMGISAWVNQKRVLIGSRALMVNHSIAVPKIEYENKYRAQDEELIYLSTDGILCAAFVVKFEFDNNVDEILTMLSKNNITVVMKTIDFFVTADLIENLYEIEVNSIKIISSQLHHDFKLLTQPLKENDSTLMNNGKIFGFCVSVCASKCLHSCIKLGSLFHATGAVCGLILLLASVLLNVPLLANPLIVFAIMVAFPLAFYIYEKNMKL